MTQPPNSTPSRAARPQLFAAPGARKPDDRGNGHADFGPSILATIDGKQPGSAGSRTASPLKRVLLMAVLAMVIAAAYLGFKSSQAQASAAPPPELPAVVSVAPVSPPLEASAPAASEPVALAVAQGAASIESVPTESVASVAPGALQKALESQDEAPKKVDVAVKPERQSDGKAESKAASKPANPTRTAAAAAPSKQAKPATKSKAAAESADADLLAAMLPHLTRLAGGPTSPGYEKRCGALAGDAEVSCRARYCNGRQGTDEACPASTVR